MTDQTQTSTDQTSQPETPEQRLYGQPRACDNCGAEYQPAYAAHFGICAACIDSAPACAACSRTYCYERARAAYGWRLDQSDALMVEALLRAWYADQAATALFVDVSSLLTYQSLWRYIYAHGTDTPGYRDLYNADTPGSAL